LFDDLGAMDPVAVLLANAGKGMRQLVGVVGLEAAVAKRLPQRREQFLGLGEGVRRCVVDGRIFREVGDNLGRRRGEIAAVLFVIRIVLLAFVDKRQQIVEALGGSARREAAAHLAQFFEVGVFTTAAAGREFVVELLADLCGAGVLGGLVIVLGLLPRSVLGFAQDKPCDRAPDAEHPNHGNQDAGGQPTRAARFRTDGGVIFGKCCSGAVF
jgi:hypothetical protein